MAECGQGGCGMVSAEATLIRLRAVQQRLCVWRYTGAARDRVSSVAVQLADRLCFGRLSRNPVVCMADVCAGKAQGTSAGDFKAISTLALFAQSRFVWSFTLCKVLFDPCGISQRRGNQFCLKRVGALTPAKALSGQLRMNFGGVRPATDGTSVYVPSSLVIVICLPRFHRYTNLVPPSQTG